MNRSSPSCCWKLSIVGGLALLLNTGCGGLPTPAQLESIAESTLLLRSSGNTVVLGKADYPTSAFSDLLSGAATEAPDVPFRVVEVNLDTLEQVLIDDAASSDAIFGSGAGLDASGRPAPTELANERWHAVLRNAGVGVVNLGSGAEQTYLTELESLVSGVSLVALDGDRLVVQLYRDSGGASLLVVLDLLSGEQRVIDRVDGFGGSPALSGDLLAFRADAPFDPQTQPLEEFFAGDRVELVDLSTGQRSIIADDLTGFSAYGPIFGDGALIWVDESYDDNGSTTRIEAYTLADGTRRVLAEYANSAESGDYVALIDVSARAALLSRYSGSSQPESIDLSTFSESLTYFVRVFGGEEVTLLEQSFETPFDTAGPGGALLTDDFAAVVDGRANELIAYDLRTGVLTRTAVFAD